MKKCDSLNKLNLIPDTEGKKATFIVKIEFCQHGTWQGQVTWAEENRTERFRSALELVRLMEEAKASGAHIEVQQEKTS